MVWSLTLFNTDVGQFLLKPLSECFVQRVPMFAVMDSLITGGTDSRYLVRMVLTTVSQLVNVLGSVRLQIGFRRL